MGILKCVALLALLFSLSLAVSADTYNDATHAKDEVKPSEATEADNVVVEPQQNWGGGCRWGCCGGWHYGRCSYCCRSPQAEGEVVEPQQRGRPGCRYCCGSFAFGQCSACCTKKAFMEMEKREVEEAPQAEAEVIEPQQACRYCCGAYAFGRCSACCSKKAFMEMQKKEGEAKP